MKNKKFPLLLLASLLVVAFVPILVFEHSNFSSLSSLSDAYGITFNSSKNIFFSGTGSTDYSGQSKIITNSKNEINFNYHMVAGGSQSSWHLIKNGGYFYNADPIHGLKSLSIQCTASDKQFRVSWGRDLSFDLGSQDILSSTDFESCDFSNDSPTFFKFENLSGSNISIKEMSVELDCINYYPSLTLSCDYEERGTVSGGGIKSAGESITIIATPKQGYRFVGWYENEELVSSSANYSFDIGFFDLIYVARFTYESYNFLVETESFEKGTVSNSSGNYNYLSQVTIEAFPNKGFSFDGWYQGLTLISTENHYTFSMPYTNLTYTAKFQKNSYDLVLTCSDDCLGTITGNGKFLYGDNVTITASPNIGVAFIGWFDINDNLISEQKIYSFVMPYNDLQYIAKFEWVSHSISLLINDENMGFVYGGGSYHYGQSVTLTATPFDHYSFFGWYDGETLISQEKVFTFEMPNNSLEYEARFVKNYNLVVYSENEEMGTVNAPSEWGAGLEITLIANPSEGFTLDYWCDENYDELSYDYEYRFIMPSCDITVIAVFITTSGTNCLFLDSNFDSEIVTLCGGGYYVNNRHVTISFVSINDLIFDGWYDENYNLVSNSSMYTFRLTQDITLIAYFHYSSLTFLFDDIDSESCALSECDLSEDIIDVHIPKFYNGKKVICINNSTFSNFSTLSSVILPNGLITIGDSVFSGCTSLTSINIPEGVTSIGSSAFAYCVLLASVVLPSSLTTIIDLTFYKCTSLTSINIPDGVTSIGGSAFALCASLSSIVLPNSVTSIGALSYSGCSSIKSIVLPKSVTSIGKSAFKNCTSLYIYCVAKSKPSGWASDWNPDKRPVTWGYEV